MKAINIYKTSKTDAKIEPKNELCFSLSILLFLYFINFSAFYHFFFPTFFDFFLFILL